MKEIKRNYWPKDVDKSLTYLQGEKPLHQYIKGHAEKIPEKVAYSFYGNKLSWAQLDEYIDRAAGFFHEHGVEKGDAVGLFMQNCPQYIIAHYAVQRLGGIVVPLNPMYKEAELEFLLNEVKVKGIVAGQELIGRIQAVRERAVSVEFLMTAHYADFVPEQPMLPLLDELKAEKRVVEDAYDFADIIKSHKPFTGHISIDIWNDIGLMVFTSGTTGRPKAAMLPYASALFKTAATVHANGMEPDDRSLAVAPLCHIAGMVMGVNIPVYTGSECVLLTRFEPNTVIEAIEKHQVTVWYSIAPMNAAILHTPGVENRNLSSLRRNMATSFGVSVTEQLAEKWKSLTGGCPLYEASYGLSETHTCDTFMPADNIKWGSCGIPTFDTELKILSLETGEPVGPDEKGEIVLKNPGVFKGYLNRPDATAETLRDGWVHTGDIGSLDEDGYLYFQGRLKEMIKCSGFSVFPEDVEALLNEHPGISQSAAIGVPDQIRGESVKAFIVLKPDYAGRISEEEVIEWAKEKMAAYKYPRYVEFLEQLPATSSGKVLRRLLKEPQAKGI
ncbi:AMP-binding protein [Mesobacillus harenae]|uniref:AMP-binding protein n=1 Tax=Mesobacillus harenae TaxID=2213203 RepID=UPI0015812C16|nr:AMP-binding protein [Mesobacillus harenae]